MRWKTRQNQQSFFGAEADAAFPNFSDLFNFYFFLNDVNAQTVRKPKQKITHKVFNRARDRTCLFVFISLSGAPTPRNRREAASRCRCTAERSTRRGWSEFVQRGVILTAIRSFIFLAFLFFLRAQTVREPKPKRFAPTGNRTRVCTVAGYYSTTRPSVLLLIGYSVCV